MLSVRDWHLRYTQQAIWTEPIRRHIFKLCGLSAFSRVLEVGCGSGVITCDLTSFTHSQITGMDIDLDILLFAAQNNPANKWIQADGNFLPIKDSAYDITLCHYFLLWIKDPGQVLLEMRRVTQPKGYVLALAEPDHAGRIDHPLDLVQLGQMQTAALVGQGADPRMGRKLSQLFHKAGFTEIQVGLLGGHWSGPPDPQALESEWAMVESDLAGQVDPESINLLRQLDSTAWSEGTRTLFVPTFYAIGRVP